MYVSYVYDRPQSASCDGVSVTAACIQTDKNQVIKRLNKSQHSCGMVFRWWGAGVVAEGEHSFGATPRLDVHHGGREEEKERPSHLCEQHKARELWRKLAQKCCRRLPAAAVSPLGVSCSLKLLWVESWALHLETKRHVHTKSSGGKWSRDRQR